MTNTPFDFLASRSHAAIRRELQSIVDSYHHYWDPLAELIQNARDAITRAKTQKVKGPHFIFVSVDATDRSIEVFDNGVGIAEDKIGELLAPGGGDKSGRVGEAGEKGVGLTYALFSGDVFDIQSRTGETSEFAGRVEGARKWLVGTSADAPPRFERTAPAKAVIPAAVPIKVPRPSIASYTRVRIGKLPPPSDDQDLFALTADQLRFLLQTRTALGDTNRLFVEKYERPFVAAYDFHLGGTTFSGEIEVGFPPPHGFVSQKTSYRLPDVQAAFVSKKQEAQRVKYLRGKTVWGVREVKAADGVIRVYGVMYPGNGTFTDLSVDPLRVSPSNSSKELDDALFRTGIFLATKRMPTGVTIEPAAGGRYPAYYKRCLFLVESDDIRFDLGRKSMHWRVQNRLKDAVASLFRDFEEVAPYQGDEKVPPGAPPTGVESKAQREASNKARWTRARSLVDLDFAAIPFQKIPDGQEAAVAAIFHELLGAGELSGYRPLTTGYQSRYDLHALYIEKGGTEELEVIIEFKHSLESIIADFEDGRKSFTDLHLMVAWDADAQKLKDSKFFLTDVTHSQFDGVTHELETPVPGVDPIPVILLQDLIRDRRKRG